MDAVTTTYDSITGGVKISWVAPNSNTESITKYLIEIYSKTNVASEDLTNCDGSSSTILSNLQCVIPMERLRTTYALVYPDLV